MKKKLFVIIPIVVLVVIVLVAAGVYTRGANNISVYISAPTQTADTSYIARIMFGGIPDFLMDAKQENLEKATADLDAFYESFTNEQQKPYFVDAKYENIDGKTVITFKGEITDRETGELTAFQKVFSYDFILTEKIDGNKNGDSKYFA